MYFTKITIILALITSAFPAFGSVVNSEAHSNQISHKYSRNLARYSHSMVREYLPIEAEVLEEEIESKELKESSANAFFLLTHTTKENNLPSFKKYFSYYSEHPQFLFKRKNSFFTKYHCSSPPSLT